MYVAHHQGDGRLGAVVWAELSFESEDAEFTPAGREVGRSDLAN